MNDNDDDLYFVDPCGWRMALCFALAAVLVVLSGFGAKHLYLLLEAM